MGICSATQVYESLTKGKINVIANSFEYSIRSGSEKFGPIRYSRRALSVSLPPQPTIQSPILEIFTAQNLKNKPSLELTVCPFKYFIPARLFFFFSESNFQAAWCVRLELSSARPNPILWAPSPCLPGRSQ